MVSIALLVSQLSAGGVGMRNKIFHLVHYFLIFARIMFVLQLMIVLGSVFLGRWDIGMMLNLLVWLVVGVWASITIRFNKG